jgi:hypothetical protein
MNKNAVFTICANNYMAQALTLKQSVLEHNSDIDFYLVLADLPCEEIKDTDVSCLDDLWCPGWRSMAFKYDITEFSTSIKPFWFNKLFKDGYEKVIYLDPDICVLDSLSCIFDILESKSIVLTPHYCDMPLGTELEGYDYDLLRDGLYNLGFVGIKNSPTGQSVVKWWMRRLEDFCFMDREMGLFTDQKWMIYVPMFFPEETCVSYHMGLNTAVWNLHERDVLEENGKYVVIRKNTGEKFPLIFFHFSGFRPENSDMLTFRKPEYNVKNYPTFAPLLNYYKETILKNNYCRFSQLKYSFNFFDNGNTIIPLHRRIFRAYLADIGKTNENPFSNDSYFCQRITKKRLISSKRSSNYGLRLNKKKEEIEEKKRKVYKVLSIFERIIGIRRYLQFIRFCYSVGHLENHYFLIK